MTHGEANRRLGYMHGTEDAIETIRELAAVEGKQAGEHLILPKDFFTRGHALEATLLDKYRGGE